MEGWREQAFDLVETAFPRTPISNQVIVVDLDRTSFERKRSWPWARDDIASLIEAIAACHPAVIAIDMLLAARAGAGPTEDSRLTEALRRAPTVLGIVLDPDSSDVDVEGPPLGTVGAIRARVRRSAQEVTERQGPLLLCEGAQRARRRRMPS